MGARVLVEGLSKEYRSGRGASIRAADGVTLEFLPGSSTALVGSSGSGKSTLLHLIGGLDQPDAGRVVVDDVVVSELRGRAVADFRARVGFVFQQFHLIPVLSVIDNVCAPLVGRGDAAATRARARELLDAVGLSGREADLPSQLSGGQQQRVAIARALVVDPPLLLADEPTGNLDSVTADEILSLLNEVRGLAAPTLVLATHDAHVAATCERTVQMRDGRAEVRES